MARTPPAKSSPVTAIPAVATTSGSALVALTTTGVPQASASSAASPKVSTGPGAITTSALASRMASSLGSVTNPANRTGKEARRAARSSRARSGPSPATTSTASSPAARSPASAASERCGFFSTDSRAQCTSSVWSGFACVSRAASLYRSGLNSSRSTPSGMRVRLGAPIRSNSAAAHRVVQTIRW